MSLNLNAFLLAGLWAGLWREVEVPEMKREMEQVILSYSTDPVFKKEVDGLISTYDKFADLVNALKQNDAILISKITRQK